MVVGGVLGDGSGGPSTSREAPGCSRRPREARGGKKGVGGRPFQAPGAPGRTWEALGILPRASFGGWGFEFRILAADLSFGSQFRTLVADPGCLLGSCP